MTRRLIDMESLFEMVRGKCRLWPFFAYFVIYGRKEIEESFMVWSIWGCMSQDASNEPPHGFI